MSCLPLAKICGRSCTHHTWNKDVPALLFAGAAGGGIATAVDGPAAFVFIIITITMCANLKMTISRSMSTYPSDSKNLCLIDDDDDDLDYSWIEDFVVKRSSFTDEKSSLSPWPTLIWLSLLSYGNHDSTVAKHYDFLFFAEFSIFRSTYSPDSKN